MQYIRDYRPMPHLDTYDGAQLDEDVNDERSAGQVIADRRAAEEFLRRRDEVEKRTGRNRLPAIMRVRGIVVNFIKMIFFSRLVSHAILIYVAILR